MAKYVFIGLALAFVTAAASNKPIFDRNHETVEVNQFSDLQITCHASGISPMTYEWYNENEERILTESGIFIWESFNGSMLTIKRMDKNNAKSYFCNASNAYGVARKEYQVKIFLGGQRKEPGFFSYYQNITAIELSKLQFICSAFGEKPMQYKWYDQTGNNVLKSNLEIIVMEMPLVGESRMTIYNIPTNLSSYYMCVASNKHGAAKQVHQVNIIPKESTFAKYSENVTVNEGAGLRIKCVANGAQPMTFDFYDQNNQVIKRDPFTDPYGKNEAYLDIYKITLDQSGSYICNASNKYGWATKVYEVTVRTDEVSPKFDRDHENVTVEESSDLELTCYARGKPPIKYTWYNKAHQIISNKSGIISETSNGSILTIYNITTRHSGKYICSAKNRYKENFKRYLVKVTLKEIITFDTNYENITVEESSNIEITCNASGTRPITYEWFDQNDQRIFSSINSSTCVSESSSASMLSIYNIKANYSGSYTCKASNAYGTVSKVYEVIGLPKGNDIIEEKLDVKDIKILNVTTRSVIFDIPSKKKFDYIDVFCVNRLKPQKLRGNYRRWYQVDSYIFTELSPGSTYDFHFEIPVAGNQTQNKTITVTLPPAAPEIAVVQLASQSVQIELLLQDSVKGVIDKYELTYYKIQQRISGGKWSKSDDNSGITILVPKCFGMTHTISGLLYRTYYEIRVRTHTKEGFGEPAFQKIYVS